MASEQHDRLQAHLREQRDAQGAHDRAVWDAAVQRCMVKIEGWSWADAARRADPKVGADKAWARAAKALEGT